MEVNKLMNSPSFGKVQVENLSVLCKIPTNAIPILRKAALELQNSSTDMFINMNNKNKLIIKISDAKGNSRELKQCVFESAKNILDMSLQFARNMLEEPIFQEFH